MRVHGHIHSATTAPQHKAREALWDVKLQARSGMKLLFKKKSLICTHILLQEKKKPAQTKTVKYKEHLTRDSGQETGQITTIFRRVNATVTRTKLNRKNHGLTVLARRCFQ